MVRDRRQQRRQASRWDSNEACRRPNSHRSPSVQHWSLGREDSGEVYVSAGWQGRDAGSWRGDVGRPPQHQGDAQRHRSSDRSHRSGARERAEGSAHERHRSSAGRRSPSRPSHAPHASRRDAEWPHNRGSGHEAIGSGRGGSGHHHRSPRRDHGYGEALYRETAARRPSARHSQPASAGRDRHHPSTSWDAMAPVGSRGTGGEARDGGHGGFSAPSGFFAQRQGRPSQAHSDPRSGPSSGQVTVSSAERVREADGRSRDYARSGQQEPREPARSRPVGDELRQAPPLASAPPPYASPATAESAPARAEDGELAALREAKATDDDRLRSMLMQRWLAIFASLGTDQDVSRAGGSPALKPSAASPARDLTASGQEFSLRASSQQPQAQLPAPLAVPRAVPGEPSVPCPAAAPRTTSPIHSGATSGPPRSDAVAPLSITQSGYSPGPPSDNRTTADLNKRLHLNGQCVPLPLLRLSPWQAANLGKLRSRDQTSPSLLPAFPWPSSCKPPNFVPCPTPLPPLPPLPPCPPPPPVFPPRITT